MIFLVFGCAPAPPPPPPEPQAAPAPPAAPAFVVPAVPTPLLNGNRAPKADAGGPYTRFQFVREGSPRPPDAPSVGAGVAFSASKSIDPDGDPLTYRWEFNDRGSATTPEVTHWYTRPGLWLVRLTVTDPYDASDVVVLEIDTPDAPPVARIDLPKACEQGVRVGETVVLSAARSTDDWGFLPAYTWSFSGGARVTTPKSEFPHVFSQAGRVDITLLVEDGGGKTASAQARCRVLEASEGGATQIRKGG